MKTKTRYTMSLAFVTLLALHTGGSAAQTYNAATDFSLSTNPNGEWSYGWTPTLGGTFTLNAFQATSGIDFSGIDMWQARLDTPPGYNPSVFHNGGATSQLLGLAVVAPGQLGLHPGPNGEFSVLRWTSPDDGSLSLTALFSGLDAHPTSTDAHVLRNGFSLFDGLVAFGPGPSYSGSMSVARGDTIDFAVGFGANGTFLFDATGLDALVTFTPVPEPSTYALLISAAVLIGMTNRWRLRNAA
jgi:hypothetical protein